MLLVDFKSQNGIAKLTVLKGKGRMYADFVTKQSSIGRLYFSQDADLSKPLYVNQGAHDALWVGNKSGAQEVGAV